MKRDEKVTGQISLIYIQMSLIYIQISFRVVIVVENSKNSLCLKVSWNWDSTSSKFSLGIFHTNFVGTLHERFL